MLISSPKKLIPIIIPTLLDVYPQPKLRNSVPAYVNSTKFFVDQFVSEYTSVPLFKINSTSRNKKHIHARFMAWYILRNVFNLGLSTIGRAYLRDHTCIINGVKRVEELYGIDFMESLGKKALSTYPHL